jgi:hypothetical protein
VELLLPPPHEDTAKTALIKTKAAEVNVTKRDIERDLQRDLHLSDCDRVF